ncbi:hypothetical protein [Actinoallomurus rhizosphaericola]|uniref:hypothetical protein n=1 Tax=Actinoallomurus rhizosphaericola TaxID=2952536 RepID=UPI0020923ED7|nr:hypothetical protein [Actinoallomurus rhizosphaericola]MCO5998910.1 hypothetical protein [Actinoallomurus rhizosphaericola]
MKDGDVRQVTAGSGRPPLRRRVAPAIALFLLAPAIGELLLGNLRVEETAAFLPVLAPLYGGGALLIRETARRAGRGPATMLILGVAYGLVEEGLADQMLFNRHYAGHDEMGSTYIPALGMGGWLTIGVLTMHAVWSTNVGIALVEALVPERSETPWLGRRGLGVTAAVFAFGTVVTIWGTHDDEHFFAAPPQLLGTAAAIVLLVVVAFRRRPAGPLPGAAPRPVVVGGIAFAASYAFLSTADLPGWWSVAAAVALLAAAIIIGGRWSRKHGWGRMHRLALTAGALLTYAWTGLGMRPESGPKRTADYVMNAVLALGAVLLVACAIRRSRAARPQPPVAARN